MIEKQVKGINYFILALLTFASLGWEFLLILIEPFIYGQDVSTRNWTGISHWSMTCILWLGAMFCILKYAKLKYGFKLTQKNSSVKLWQWLLIAVIMILKVYESYNSWGGFKPLIELSRIGSMNFYFQYIYYFVETLLFSLIIIFGQKAFEKWFKHENIPYGGIVCGLTWGLGHIVSKGSLMLGVLGVIVGFGFGAVYLLVNRDTTKAFPILFLMFVL